MRLRVELYFKYMFHLAIIALAYVVMFLVVNFFGGWGWDGGRVEPNCNV